MGLSRMNEMRAGNGRKTGWAILTHLSLQWKYTLLTYIIGIDSRGENPSSDTVNSYDHNCIGRYAVLFLNPYI